MRAWTLGDVRSLRGEPEERAFEGALEALLTEDDAVRDEACRVLEGFSDLDHRLRAVLERAPQLGVEGVLFLRREALLEDVAELVRASADPGLRGRAAQVMGLLGGARFEDVLAAAIEDASPRTRTLAAAALGSLGTPSAVASVQAAWARETDAGARVVMTDVLDRHGALP